MEYRDPMEVYAAVFGYLIRTFGKIQTAKVNKIVEELGYDKVNVKSLKEHAEKIEEDEHLTEILEKAIDGEITPDELKKYNTDEEPIESEEDIHNVLTPYMAQHQRVLKNNRYFNKVQREGAYLQILIEDMKEDFKQDLKGIDFGDNKPFEFQYEPKSKKLMVIIGDWHVGSSIVDTTYHGGYNYEILNNRLKYLLDEVAKEVAIHHPEEIVCIFVGDMIEGADMRGGQKWKLEFDLSEQVTKSYRTLLKFLLKLEKLAPVRFSAVRGNHDRLTGQVNKNDNIYNDSSLYIILDFLMLLQEFGALSNTEFVNNLHDMYDTRVEVFDQLVVGNHGDALKGKGSHFSKFVEDRAVNMLITGHVHTFKVNQDHRDHIHITNGSIMGYNDYAKELKLTKTAPEQTIVVLEEGESPTIVPVFMEHVK